MRNLFLPGSVVYFVHRRGKPQVKVGHTDNMRRRFKELATENRGERLVLLATIPASEDDEHTLHKILDPWKQLHDGSEGGGEWFELKGLSAFAEALRRDEKLSAAFQASLASGLAEEALRAGIPAMAKTPKWQEHMLELKTYIPARLREWLSTQVKLGKPVHALVTEALEKLKDCA